MGAWGAGLYQDDVTCDIKSDYINRLKIGMTNEEALKDLIEMNMDYIDDEDDGPLFWFALADVQWKYGRLHKEVKELALKHIKEGKDLERWKENKSLFNKRKKVLEDLENRLKSPQPEEKKVSKLSIKKANWEVGDVILYKIRSEYIREEDLGFVNTNWYGKYVLFRVLAITKSNIGSLPREYSHEQNIVALYNWIGDSEPDLEIIDKLKFIITKDIFGKYTDTMYILSFNRRELKELNIKVIKKDSEYLKLHPEYLEIDDLGKSWLHSRNWDSRILRELNIAKKENYLINDIKNK